MNRGVNLRAVLEREAQALASEPDALPATLYKQLSLEAWDPERTFETLRFDPRPQIRFRQGLPPPRRTRPATMWHRRRVLGVALAPNGLLFSWSEDGIVICRDLASEDVIWWLGTHPSLRAAQVTGDGRFLATASGDGHVAVWALGNRAALLWESPTVAVAATAILADRDLGRVVAGYADGYLLAFELMTGVKSDLVATAGPAVEHLARIGPDTVVGACADGTLVWCDVPAGHVRQHRAHDARIVSLRQTEGGGLVSASEDGWVRSWGADGSPTDEYQGVLGVQGATRTGDVFIVWATDGTVVRVRNGKEDGLWVHRHAVRDVQIGRSRSTGKTVEIVSGAADGTVAMYLSTNSLASAEYHHDAPVVGCLRISAGEAISWDEDGHILVASKPRLPTVRRLGETATLPVRLHYSVSRRSLVVSGERDLTCYDAESLVLMTKQVLASRHSPWPRTLSLVAHLGYADDRPVERKMRDRQRLRQSPWKVSSPERVRALRRFLEGPQLKDAVGVAVAQDEGNRWASAAWDNTSVAFRREGETRFSRERYFNERISNVTWVKPDRVAVATWDGVIHLAGATNQVGDAQLTGHSGRVFGCVLTDEDVMLSWGADKTVRLWQISVQSQQLASITLPATPTAFAELPDGRVALGTDDGHIVCTDTSLRTVTGPRSAHHGRVTGLAPVQITPDIRGLVSCGEDQRLRLWRLSADGAEHVEVVMSEARCVQLVALGRQATAVAMLDEAGAIWIFDVGEAPPTTR